MYSDMLEKRRERDIENENMLEKYEDIFDKMTSNAAPTAFPVDGKRYAGKIFNCDALNQATYDRLVSYFEDLEKFLNTFKENM